MRKRLVLQGEVEAAAGALGEAAEAAEEARLCQAALPYFRNLVAGPASLLDVPALPMGVCALQQTSSGMVTTCSCARHGRCQGCCRGLVFETIVTQRQINQVVQGVEFE